MERQQKQPTRRGPAEWFTGDVYVDAITGNEDAPRASLGSVHFTPGARTAWHAHDAGQALYVVEGVGIVAERGGEALALRPGDVVHAPAGEWHWHGATPDHFMTHISITETGTAAQWGAQVTDDEYQQAVSRINGSQE